MASIWFLIYWVEAGTNFYRVKEALLIQGQLFLA